MLGRERKGVYILSVLLFLNFYGISFAQDSDVQKNNWLLGVIFKLERMGDNAIADIQRYESEIQRCNATIGKSENIIRLARQQGNAEAERIAGSALSMARQAKLKNEGLKNSAELRKQRAEVALTSVKNKISVNSNTTPVIDAVALNYYGDITILKNNGEQLKLNNTQNSLIENGDVITTSQNSKVELQFLEGRGNIHIGENTKLKFNQQDSTDVIDLIKGKVKLGVQKIDEFEKDLIEAYDRLFEDIQGIDKSLKKIIRRFEVRTPTAVTSVRGTEFLVNHDDMKGTEIIVLEGSVEMKSTVNLKTILINEGQKGVINNEGVLLDPQKIDLSKLGYWWEE